MLRINNRNLSISNTTRPQGRKQDNVELLSVLDKCSQILRDDRIALRYQVKEQQNPKLIELLLKYKKKNTNDDLQDLQIELRKFLNEQKGRKIVTSPERRDFVKKKSTQSKENQYVSPPHQVETKTSDRKVSSISQTSERKISELSGSHSKQSFVTLSRGQDELQKRVVAQNSSSSTPVKEDDDQLQFMTIVSQSPHQISQILPQRKDTEPEEVTLSLNKSQDVLLRYNVEEINGFRDDDDDDVKGKDLPKRENQVCQHCGQNKESTNDQTQTVEEHVIGKNNVGIYNIIFQSILVQLLQIPPKLESLNFRDTAQSQYKHLFTDWSTILKPTQLPNYQFIEKNTIDCVPFSNGDSNLGSLVGLLQEQPENQSSQISQRSLQSFQFTIHGISPDVLFTILFPSCYQRKLNAYQMRINLEKTLPGCEVDIETLFKLCDEDADGWATSEDVGNVLEDVCEKKAYGQEYLDIQQLMLGEEKITVEILDRFLQAKVLQGQADQFEVEDLGRRLFEEIDLNNKGYLTKWDLYHNREISQIQKLKQLH